MMDIKEALVFMAMLNVLIFLVQLNIVQINPAAAQFFNYADSPLQSYDAGNYTLETDLSGAIPQSSSGISVNEEGNFFTDTFATLGSWVRSRTGVRYVTWILTAPGSMIAYWQILPQAYVFAFSWLWWIFGVLLLVIFVRG